MKRFLAVLTALTMIISTFSVVALADVDSSKTVVGGKWANPVLVENITTTLGSTADYTITVSDNSMKVEPLKVNNSTATSNIQFTSKSLDSLAWVQTGCIEITYTVSYTGTLASTDSFGFGVAFTSYNGSSRSWVLSAGAWEIFPFESGATKDIKYIVEYTDSNTLVHRYIKDTTSDSWTYVDTVTKAYIPSEGYRKVREIIPYAQQWIRSSSTDAAATMSNLCVREVYKNPELESLTDSYDTSLVSSVDISYVVPEDYDKAELTAGGKVFAEFDSDTANGGAYKTTIDFSELPYFGAVPVELTVINKNGNVTAKSTTLNITAPTEKALYAYTDFDGNESTNGTDTKAISSTAGHIFGNSGKTGAGIAISSLAADASSTDCYYVASFGSHQSSAYVNAVSDDTDKYCYEIEFDVKQEGAGGKIGVNYKDYVDGSAQFVAGAWNYPVTKATVNGVANTFEIDGNWHKMKFIVNCAANTLTTYYEGEQIGEASVYNADGCYYFGVAYALYADEANAAAISIDNVKVCKYIPGYKTGVASVAVDQVAKTVSITAEAEIDETLITDSNVTLTVDGNAVAASAALADDGKTVVVTPASPASLKGKDAVVNVANAVLGYAFSVPVSFVEDYSNRKIAADIATSGVDASVDIIADAADEDAGIMYIAYYKNGSLAHVYKTDITTTAAGLATYNVSYTPETRVDYDTVKVFVWDAYKTPLLKVYSK